MITAVTVEDESKSQSQDDIFFENAYLQIKLAKATTSN